MNKHFLVTISNDDTSLKGVEFLCSFFKEGSGHQLTILHICRLDSNDMNSALMEMWDQKDDKIQGKLTVGAKKAIDRANTLLSAAQMSIDQIVTKTVAERFGKVRDIAEEGSRGLYDAIVLGKRASYTLQWLFERPADEIAQSMIKESCFSIPLWICPEIEDNRKNVLLCVDGSENSFRAVDHAGFILSTQDQHAITILHVKSATGPKSHTIFPRAEAILASHNIDDKRIETVSTWGFSIPGTILGLLDRHHYAVVALGLHGQQEGMLKEYHLAGKTASTLIAKIEGAALWCCP